MKVDGKGWIVHLITRMVAIPLLFVIIYQVILGDRTDPMGFGLVYAFITTACLCFLYFGIECIVLYRKKQVAKFYVNLLLLFVSIFSILIIL